MPEEKVFDADGHIVEKDQSLLEYFDPPYRRNRRLLDTPFYPSLDGWHRQAMVIADGQKKYGVQEARMSSGEIDDLASWLSMMDRVGIEQAVIYPSRGLGTGFIKDPEWAVALCRAYNNFLSENYLKQSSRIHGMALLPLQDVGEAINELRRAIGDLKMLGGVITPVGLPFPLGHPTYHPLFAEAERLECPIGLHGGPTKGLGFDYFDKLIQARALSHPFCQLIQLTSIVLEGVLEKYPRVRIISLEAGVSWVPLLMDRLDWEWEKRGSRQARLLKRKPSEYISGGRVYFHCDVAETILPSVVNMIGEDYLLYASDYPHERDQVETINTLRFREDLPLTCKQKILYHNAAKCYGLTG